MYDVHVRVATRGQPCTLHVSFPAWADQRTLGFLAENERALVSHHPGLKIIKSKELESCEWLIDFKVVQRLVLDETVSTI